MKKGLRYFTKKFIARINRGNCNIYLIIPVVLSAFLLLFGYITTIPLTATYDPAMHSEVVDPVISTQIYPLTWSPLADTKYTYPPLFHWLAFLISRFGIEPVTAVIFLGLVLYAVFPFCLYLLGSFWSRKIGLLSAIAGAFISSWSFVFLAGEYPQLLAMDLSVVFIYYYLKRDYVKSGVFLGLTFLSHPFVPVYLTIFVLIHSFLELGRKNKDFFITSLKCLMIALVITSIWLPQYFMIIQSATTHQWRNVRWYYKPGFVGFEEVNSLFFSFTPMGRINPVIFILSLAGAGLILKKGFKNDKKGDKTALLVLFLFMVAFSVFHIPGTQYKFPDMLSIAIPPLSALGISYSSGKLNGSKRVKNLIVVLIALVFLFSAYNVGLVNLNFYSNKQKFVSTPYAREAGLWLRNYDPEYSRIVKTGEDEVWFSVISHKYAMDPMITDLEVLTENTKAQMGDREIIIEKINQSKAISGLVEKYEIRYVITEGFEASVSDGQLIYDKDDVKIYKFSGKTS